MYEAILFDLDGTLLGLDNDRFVEIYFKSLAPKLAPYYPNSDFTLPISAATEAMIRSDGRRGTLRDVFIATFDWHSDVKFSVVEPVFIDFYQGDFDNVRALSRPLPLAPAIITAATKLCDKLVLATVPVFPRIAIEARLRWGGLDDSPFTLITSFENMHYSKPNPAYYQEIAEKIKAEPGKCLMIGNDHRDDLAAAGAGMETFWVMDEPLNAGLGEYAPTYSGSLQNLFTFLHG